MKLSTSILCGAFAIGEAGRKNKNEAKDWITSGCATGFYNTDLQQMECAISGAACDPQPPMNKGRSIGFSIISETPRLMVAQALVKTAAAGDWPSVTNGDSYIGFLRFDAKFCPDEMLNNIVMEYGLSLDVGDKDQTMFGIDTISYHPDGWTSKNAMFAQFRKIGTFNKDAWNGKKKDQDKFYISMHVAPWYEDHTYEDVKTCLEKVFLTIAEDDGNGFGTTDYTKCAAYTRYGLEPDWQPWGDQDSDETTTTGSWVSTTTDAGTSAAGTTEADDGGDTPDGFEEITEDMKIQPGLFCASNARSAGNKIVGGVDATHGSYPWQVRLDVGGGQCGGTIIHNRWVLTAAHCCDGVPANQVTVFVGDHDQYSNDDPNEFSVTAQEVINHPDYNGQVSIDHDVCLLKLPNLDNKQPAACKTRNNKPLGCYQKACLPEAGEDIPAGKACFVSGWGTTKKGGGGNVAQFLQQVAVNVFSDQYCQDKATGDMQADGHTPGIMFCAGLPDRNNDGASDAGKDSCQGDSGGPFVCVQDDSPVLTGVVSWGYGCANKGNPGVYATVSAYMDWIKEKTASYGANFAV